MRFSQCFSGVYVDHQLRSTGGFLCVLVGFMLITNSGVQEVPRCVLVGFMLITNSGVQEVPPVF